MPLPRLILASASPRRLELLRTLGLRPEVRHPGIREDRGEDDPPREHVLRLARAKAAAVAAGIGGQAALVLSADTAVVVGGKMLGKPRDEGEAEVMLRSLSGRAHEVVTGVHIERTDDGRAVSSAETTRVRFRNCSDALIRWYVSTGEPLDKAGAYGIQARGALLVASVEGSWTNVVGLPLEILPELFLELGVDVLRLLRGPLTSS